MKKLFIFSLAFLIIGYAFFNIVGGRTSASINPNNLLDDAVFENSSAMNATQIDSFLNSFSSSCISTHNGFSTPDPTGWSSSLSTNHGYTFGGNVSAGTAIYHASRIYNVNPRVILATLQKEQSVVTGNVGCHYTNPSHGQACTYSGGGCVFIAMSYACPGTCDYSYNGFSLQLIAGTWLLRFSEQRAYGILTGYIGHDLGDENIFYSGPMTKGNRQRSLSSPVTYFDGTYTPQDYSTIHIANGATAALYYYTPFVSGNTSFVNLFEGWFGSVYGSYIVRSNTGATVYLMTNNNKYPISNMATVEALYPLGSVKTVDQQTLNSKTTQGTLKRLIKGSSATIYFFDAGIKLSFPNCTLVTQYGMSCADVATLNDNQIDKLVSGPSMTDVVATTSGKLFNINNGVRKEALDSQSLTDAGISSSANKLNDSSISYLPESVPIVRDNVLLKSRTTTGKYLYTSSTKYTIPSGISSLSFLSTIPGGYLDQASIDNIAATSFTGFITNGTNDYLIDNSGKAVIGDPADWSSTYTNLPAGLFNLIPASATSINSQNFYKANNRTVYYVSSIQKAPMASWTDVLLIDPAPSITSLPQYYLDQLSTIRPQFGPTRLVKSTTSATVYMVDGTNKKWTITSLAIPNAMSISSNGITTQDSSVLNQYTTQTGNLSQLVGCNSKNYIATQGVIREINNTLMQAYGFTNQDFMQYQANSCTNLKTGSALTEQYMQPIGQKSIYYIENGVKEAFSSYSAYVAHGGNSQNTIKLEPITANLIPNGPILN